MSKRLGHRLRDERRERGESQRTCAPRFGISQSGYSFWESGINDPDASLTARVYVHPKDKATRGAAKIIGTILDP